MPVRPGGASDILTVMAGAMIGVLLGVFVAGIDSFTPAVYAAFKGVWAGAIAGVLVILMVLVALREVETVAFGRRAPVSPETATNVSGTDTRTRSPLAR